ncbi:MAG: pyridoxamine 5'-phosphate oxidase [Micromonosporaceae bacterium]
MHAGTAAAASGGEAAKSLPQLAALRAEYGRVGLAEVDLAPDWLSQFVHWLQETIAAGVPEPNAMVLATADAAGRPSARTVLLKDLDAAGLVCYTNLGSRKASEAAANPHVALVFPWYVIGRQVIVTGRAEPVGRDQTEGYFATRPRAAQLGAWASPQSRVVADRAELEAALAEVQERFPGPVPTPAHWGGLRVVPETVEFWQGREGRMHDRLRYRRDGEGWVVERLAP